MTGQQTSWSGFFRTIGQQIAQLGLQQLEAPLLKSLNGGSDDDSGGSGFLSKLGGFFSGRAVGGNVDANSTYLVGERGPELLTMGSKSGRVTPNGQIGGNSHSYTIDARGSQDPAAVEAAVARGIAAAAPHIIAGSVSAVNEKNSRIALSSRR